jgi:hypothetical protein
LYGVLQSEGSEFATDRYVDTGIDAAGAVFRLGILSLTGLLFVWKIAPSWRVAFPKDYKLVALGSYMMMGFFSLFFVSTVIGDRFGYYLIPIQTMIFARLPYLYNMPNRNLLAALPYVGLSLVFVVWTQSSRHFQQCYIPYDTVPFG